MVHNVFRVPAILLAYTLMILMITNGINGENLLDKIVKIVTNTENEIKSIHQEVTSIETKVDSIVDTINQKTIDIEEKVRTMLGDITIIKGNVGTIGGHVDDHIVNRCPESGGYFFAPGTGQSQCLKVIYEKLTWDLAAAKCKEDTSVRAGGLVLARPFNARALRTYLFQRYDSVTDHWNYWVGAQGDSVSGTMVWADGSTGQTQVDNNSPLWRADDTGRNTGKLKTTNNDDFCMTITTHPNNIQDEPDQVYYTYRCDQPALAICELPLN